MLGALAAIVAVALLLGRLRGATRFRFRALAGRRRQGSFGEQTGEGSLADGWLRRSI